MKTWIKKQWLIIAFIAFMIIPITLNYCLNINIGTTIIGNPKDWLMFWGSYIGGFASFVMLYVAWRTLRESKSANRPIINIKLIRRYSMLYLEIKNDGKSPASKIKIKFDDDFISNIKLTAIKRHLESIEEQEFRLPAGNLCSLKLCYSSVFMGLLNYINGASSINKTLKFNESIITLDESNNNYNYFDQSLEYISITYNDEYKEKIPIRISNFEDAPQDTMKIIALSLEAIEKHLGTISNPEKEKN